MSKIPAYDECYLDSMLQKNRYLFRLMARNCSNIFDRIRQYMKCEYRQLMDMGNPLYLNKTPKQILSTLGITVVSDAEISRDYDEFILDWMADIYNYMQWKYGLRSKNIVETIPPEELYKKYYPLHETSLVNGVEKLRVIYGMEAQVPDSSKNS